MRIVKKAKLFFLSLLVLTSFSCNKDSSSQNQGDPTLSIRLMDMPGDYEHVFIDVQDVMIKYNDDSEDDSGWQSLASTSGVYDLLELTGGVNVVLVDEYEIPAGTLNQIRLVLGENNTVVIDGETFPLKTPSAQQSGLKLKVNHELEEGFTYNFLLDFDVDKSIVRAGNSGNINLKPVIRVNTEFASGKIQGSVTPFNFQILASVVVDGETVSAYADESGIFVLNAIPGGIYDVTITPDPSSDYAEIVVEGIGVVNGEITIIDPIALSLKTGSITGGITNEGVAFTASIMVDGEEVLAETNESGEFLFENIKVGIYTVSLVPEAGSGLTNEDITDVLVEEGIETVLEHITLE